MKAGTAKIYGYLKAEELIELILAGVDRRDCREVETLLRFLQKENDYQGMDIRRIIAACSKGDKVNVLRLTKIKAEFEQARSEFFSGLTRRELEILIDMTEKEQNISRKELGHRELDYSEEEGLQILEKMAAFYNQYSDVL